MGKPGGGRAESVAVFIVLGVSRGKPLFADQRRKPRREARAVGKKAIQSFRLRLHSSLRQSGSVFDAAGYGRVEDPALPSVGKLGGFGERANPGPKADPLAGRNRGLKAPSTPKKRRSGQVRFPRGILWLRIATHQ